MSSTIKIVEDCIRADTVTREALARGVVNYRALAQWLLRTHRLAATEASVIAALRRFKHGVGDDHLAGAREVLRDSYVNSRARRSSFTVPNTTPIQERLPRLLKSIDYSKGETIRILSFDGGFKIVLDESNFQDALQILGEKNVEDTKHGLVELNVVMPPDCTDTPGIYALIANALAARRINIEEGWVSIRQEVVFVKEEDLLEAHDALSSLTSQGDAVREENHRLVPARAPGSRSSLPDVSP
ncbi:MAG: hypothetical protein WDA16_03110 [Candidatus Thermoplasmatota archaeon]